MAMENAHHGVLNKPKVENQATEMEEGRVIVKAESFATIRVIVVHCAQNQSWTATQEMEKEWQRETAKRDNGVTQMGCALHNVLKWNEMGLPAMVMEAPEATVQLEIFATQMVNVLANAQRV